MHGDHTRSKTFLTREALEQLPGVTLKLGRLDAAYLAKVGLRYSALRCGWQISGCVSHHCVRASWVTDYCRPLITP